MKYGHASIFLIASAAVVAACAAPVSPSPEAEGKSSAAVTAGISAALTVTGSSGQTVYMQGTVTNGSPNPASNWQVAVNLNNSTLNGGTNGAEVNVIGGQPVFSVSQNGSALAAGASTNFSFVITKTSSTNFTPTIATVDGESNGAAEEGISSTGIDNIAQIAATGAVNIAIAYEANKLANTGDSLYAQYDNLLWDAHTYMISGSTIVFDPSAPGYAFVPNAAKAELAFMQMVPTISSYLVDGLQSCFNNTSGAYVFNFRAGVLAGYAAGTTTTGTLGGVVPPSTSWTPSGYNVNSIVDNFTTVGQAAGASTFTTTLTGTKSPANETDYWFGLLTYTPISTFSNTATVMKKYGTIPSGNQAACSPFNGPGGTANPSFTVSLNGQKVSARFQGVGAQCQNGCTSTLVVDPAKYMTPGTQTDASGNVLGPEINPFTLNQDSLVALAAHSLTPVTLPGVNGYVNSIVGGVTTLGTFSVPVVVLGITKYQYTPLSQ